MSFGSRYLLTFFAISNVGLPDGINIRIFLGFGKDSIKFSRSVEPEMFP